MRDILDKIKSSETRYDFVQSLTESKETPVVTESYEKKFAQLFAPLGKALEMLVQAQAVVSETMVSYMKAEAAKLSTEYRDSYVVLDGGNGRIDIAIYPSQVYADRLDQLMDSGDGYMEDEALEFQALVGDLNDLSSRAPFAPFKVNEELAKYYGVNTWNIGRIAFRNGQEADVAAAMAHAKTLSSLVQRMGRGG